VVDVDGMDLVEQDAQVVPIVDDAETTDSAIGFGNRRNSEGSGLGDSRHATPDSDVSTPDERLIIDWEGCYLGLSEAGRDVQYLGSVIVEMGTLVPRLVKSVDELEDIVDTMRSDWAAARTSPPRLRPFLEHPLLVRLQMTEKERLSPCSQSNTALLHLRLPSAR